MSATDLIEVALNEVESLASKAARGAGLAWGLADEVGYSARWLAEHRVPWIASLLRLLDRAGNSDVSARSPVLLGAWLADSAGVDIDGPALELKAVEQPLWIVPPLARASAALGCFCFIRAAGHTIVLGPDKNLDGVNALHELASIGELDLAVSLSATHKSLPRPAKASRSRVSQPSWASLEALAQKTYVPSSSQSRATGAGAGLQDND